MPDEKLEILKIKCSFIIICLIVLIVGGIEFYALRKGVDGKVMLGSVGILCSIGGFHFKNFIGLFKKDSTDETPDDISKGVTP
jgi:hypothetical protein